MNFNPTEKEIDFINQALTKFNDEKVGPDNHELLNIVEYDENKNIIGGILGGTYWGWMHIDILWVDENFRKKGIGSQLLKAAEEEARKRGSTAFLQAVTAAATYSGRFIRPSILNEVTPHCASAWIWSM